MAKKYDAHITEEKVLSFWKENKIHEKVSEKIKEGEEYYFLDGPPYTSGYVHIGTAWNKALKDCILRYKRAKGFKVWDRAGYDMHGLPVEHKVQAKLGLKLKEDIEKYGIEKFIKECKKLAEDNLLKMNEDFKRIGVWMDFENPYKSVSKDYIQGIWWLIKQAHEKKRLYENYRTTYWDYVHQTALAKHELEYETVVDKSIFVKFPVKGKENEFLVVWTTTPWTIAYNLGVMVNPKLDYIKAKVDTKDGENGEIWILAKGLAAPVVQTVAGKTYETLEEFKGSELKGLEYVHPFAEILKEHYEPIKAEHENVHTVVMSEEYVTLGAGTGLVHMAPGCGPEDYEVGYKNNIPAWNNLKEDGTYPENMGEFSGYHAKHDNGKFIDKLEELKKLVAITEVEHEYPFGQRSHKPVVFRATKQWFFKIEDLKEQLIKENNEIKWLPEAAYNAFNSWLENLRDNSISKQRYWGTPLPIWRNVKDEEDIIVIGSISELEELSGKKLDDPHLPWIDEIVIEKDGKTYKRVLDVLDVWVDAGTASWNCLNFPRDKETFKKYFPAEFILEGKDQIRGWFNLLSIASMLGFERKSFKNVYMHGFVQDSKGRKMSKSLGNTILPGEVIEKYSADVLRYYMIGGANPGLDINYNFDDMKTKNRNLGILWNLHNYLIDLCKTNDYNPKTGEIKATDTEEQLMMSKLHSTIKECTETFDAYKLNEVPGIIEKLFLELSRGYIQKVRDKLTTGSKEEKENTIQVIYEVLMNVLKLLTPVAPFMSEEIYQTFKKEFGLETESISLFDWPEFDENYIDKELEEHFEIIDSLEQSMLFAREKAQLGIRWPLKEIIVETTEEKIKTVIEKYNDLLKAQVNVKDITVVSDAGFEKKTRAEFKEIQKEYGPLAPKIITKLVMELPSVVKKIEDNGEAILKIDGADILLNKKHFVSELKVPEKYAHTQSKKSNIFLDKDMDEELLAEGFSREVMRRVQIARKKAGLQKTDTIELILVVSEKMKKYLETYKNAICEKVGAKSLELLNSYEKELTNKQEFKIKDENIIVMF